MNERIDQTKVRTGHLGATSQASQFKRSFWKGPQGWVPLKPGDIVDLVAPGFACTEEQLRGAVNFLLGWGLKPRVPDRIFARDVIASNTDDARMAQLKSALRARDSRAVWCVRGGYGSIRLVPELARVKRPAGPPKLFIGLSDITTLHVFLNQQWNWPTVHGPLLDRLGAGRAQPKYEREMKRFIFGEMSDITFDKLKPLNERAAGRGRVRGPVSGGNLITLQSSLGTLAPWSTKGRILFFEDIGERGYRVDRVLDQFRQIGYFTKAKAVIFGQFIGGNEADGTTRLPAVLKRFAEGLKIPVFSGLASGHDKIQRPLPFETDAVLELGDRGTLTVCSGAERR
jgi:muramoyltetrapeptide carboxypeptidase